MSERGIPRGGGWRRRALGWLGSVLLVVVQTQCALFQEKPSRSDIPPHIAKKLGPLAPRGVEDSLGTPAHTFSQVDYPFDSGGRYREEWVSTSTERPGPRVRRGGGSPVASSASGGSRSTPTARSSGSRSSSSSSASARRHVVRRGDTLFGLSRQYGVTVHALRRANGLGGDTIRVGQVLKIPAS